MRSQNKIKTPLFSTPEQVEKKKQYYREYYKKNKDLYLERNRNHVDTPEQIEAAKEYKKKYYPAYKKRNRLIINERQRVWNKQNRLKNGNKLRAKAREYYHKKNNNKTKEVKINGKEK